MTCGPYGVVWWFPGWLMGGGWPYLVQSASPADPWSTSGPDGTSPTWWDEAEGSHAAEVLAGETAWGKSGCRDRSGSIRLLVCHRGSRLCCHVHSSRRGRCWPSSRPTDGLMLLC